MIRASAITKSFTTAAGPLDILRGIDLHVAEGEFVAIVGASGAGKSTLLHILGSLDRPTSGDLTIAGARVTAMSPRELTGFRNRTVGFVFQFHHLLPEFTAIENVMMPLLISGAPHAESASHATALLDRLGLSSRLHHRPGELSGGEQQRVAVARALVMKPRLVLADEPTGNLDTRTGDELFGLLHTINREMKTTFVMVTHNNALSTQCDRTLTMTDGLIT